MKSQNWFLLTLLILLQHINLKSQFIEIVPNYSSQIFIEAENFFEQLSIRRAEQTLFDNFKLMKYNPTEDRTLILQSNIDFFTGNYYIADERLKTFISNNSPFKPFATLLRAYIQFEQKNFNKAAELFMEADKIAENEYILRKDTIYRTISQNALFWGGISYSQLGKYPDAKPLFEKCYINYPELKYADDALYSLAITEEINRNYNIAISYYNTIYKKYPYSNSYIASRIREINNKLLMREPYTAIDLINHTQNIMAHIAINDSIGALYETQTYVPQIPANLLYLSGEAQNIAGNYEKALFEFQTFLQTYQSSKLLNYVRLSAAWALLHLNKYNEAIEFLDKIIENPEDVRTTDVAKLYRAVAFKKVKNREKAKKEFQDLSVQPTYIYLGQALLELGQMYYEEGDFANAKRILERAKREANDNVALIRTNLFLGSTYMELRNWNSAIMEFNAAEQLALRTSDIFLPKKNLFLSEARLKKGVALVLENRNNEAIKTLNAFLAENKNDKRIDEALFWLAEAYYRSDLLQNAIDRYELILSKYPGTIRKEEVLYGLGWSYFRLKDFKKSSKIFNELVEKYPDSKYALEVLARQADGYYIIKDYKNAADMYKKAAELSPKSDEGQYCAYQLCHALYRLGEYDKAITYLLSFVRSYPESKLAPYSLYLIGWIRFQQKNYKEAIINFEFLTKAYASNDLSIRAYYSIGDAYYNLGEYQKAIDSYNVIVKNYPSHELASEAWRSMQYCYVALGKEEEAMKIADSVIALHPKTVFAQELFIKKAEMFYSGARYTDAISEYRNFIKAYPESEQNDEAIYWMAKSYLNLDDYENALNAFDQLINKYPKSEFTPLAYFEKSMIYKRIGELTKSDSMMSKVEELFPDTPTAAQAGFEKAVLKFEMGDTLAAIKYYDYVANKYSGYEYADQARYRLASYYRNNGENDSARYHYQIIANNKLDLILSAEAQYRVGELWMKDTNWVEAEKAFTVVRENFAGVETWYPLSLLSLGECYEKLGKIDEAIEVYQSLLSLNPDDEYAKTVKVRLKRLEKSK